MEAVFFEVDFLSAAIIQLIVQLISGAVIFPALYSNINLDSQYVSYLLMYCLTNFASLLLYQCIFDFCMHIMVENKTKSVEYSQLLNWVKSGLIML